jgi:hypothetical protein
MTCKCADSLGSAYSRVCVHVHALHRLRWRCCAAGRWRRLCVWPPSLMTGKRIGPSGGMWRSEQPLTCEHTCQHIQQPLFNATVVHSFMPHMPAVCIYIRGPDAPPRQNTTHAPQQVSQQASQPAAAPPTPHAPCRFAPSPIVARSEADILSARGVKPVLSPNLETLAAVEAAGERHDCTCMVRHERMGWR